MFRSVMNIDGAERDTLEGRQRHDFIDDLESFFWVYAWMITAHNGPGLKGLVPDSEKSCKARVWETCVDPSYHAWKQWYLRDFYDPEFANFTPYFSKPVYLTLLHDLRSLLHSYCHQKSERPKDKDGNWLELNFFDEMDEIYSKVLGFFDTAIKTISPPPKLPTRLQPDRQAKRPRDEDQTAPLPSAKRARLNLLPRAGPPNTTIREATLSVVSLNVRRSERLKARRRVIQRH